MPKKAKTLTRALPLAPPNGHTSWLAYAVATMDDRSLQNDHDAGQQPQWPADVTREQMRSAAAAELKEFEEIKHRKLLDAVFDEINAAGFYESSASYTGDQRSTLPPSVLKAGLEVFTTEEALRQWLDTPAGAWAGGRTPQQLIDAAREADVVGALKGLAHGNFL